ncbi:hypothetical protein PIB30_028546 [Stylosanthes scabra]|uniref:MraW methylase family protein n=1 Tax=Stylosanthes scabra TaxID=79078 RepID=A0ABU6SAJ8_9FABA|nr:hypothetical protein [Stylosanthes scabra]
MAILYKISSLSLSTTPLLLNRLQNLTSLSCYSFSTVNSSIRSTTTTSTKKQKQKSALAKEKRRTRSDKDFDMDAVMERCESRHHIPVMLAEVLDVFSTRSLTSFVDCTLGAAGHSSAVINGHGELKYFVGMDVDPVAHDMAQAQINSVLEKQLDGGVKVFTFLRNFRHIKSTLRETGEEKLVDGSIDGILMDLGMSSMQVDNPQRGFSVLADGPLDMRMDLQASLKAEDILNSWPESEVGRVLRDYGEESNWRNLQKKIVQARLNGGLHSTSDLLDLICRVTPAMKGGRQGWIKTATRVFQALRIAVNDELKTLEDSLYSCFDCLSPGGRLAVISFHSLEDRIVKQTFLDIIKGSEDESCDNGDLRKVSDEMKEKESWIKHVINGSNGIILTKRPITPSAEEEKLNRRSRSAKLRVIQKQTNGVDIPNTASDIRLLPSLDSVTEDSSGSNVKRANLSASKTERIKLPDYNDGIGGKKYHISEFLSQPSGIAAVLNTGALQTFESLDANTYRCSLPKLQFLNFEAAPMMDLRVTSTEDDCLVEMLSCKFEGSEIVEEQNSHFSDAESFLEVDVKLNLTLEIYTRPFTMMPVSAVERPGNLMMQTLVDKLVPLLLQQMLQDYDEWVQKQLENTT